MYYITRRLAPLETSRHRWRNTVIIPAAIEQCSQAHRPYFLTTGIPGAVHIFSFYQQSSCKIL